MMEHKSDNLSPADSIEGGDFWTDLPEHVKQTIEKAKQQLDDGKGIQHQQVMKNVKGVFLNK